MALARGDFEEMFERLKLRRAEVAGVSGLAILEA